MIKGWYPSLVSSWIRDPAIGVPVKKATAVTLPNAPSLAPSLSIGVICAVAAGMTDMKMPEANPYTHANPTSTAGVFAGSHIAKQNTPQRVTIG